MKDQKSRQILCAHMSYSTAQLQGIAPTRFERAPPLSVLLEEAVHTLLPVSSTRFHCAPLNPFKGGDTQPENYTLRTTGYILSICTCAHARGPF